MSASDTQWELDGSPIGRNTQEVVTNESLTLTQRVETKDLLDTLRVLKANEEQVDVLPVDDGGFTAVDRANGANTFTLDPPESRKPLRQSGEYHVRKYQEDLVSADVGEWDVEVEFVRSSNRTDAPSYTDLGTGSGASFAWTFDQAFTYRPTWVFQTRHGDVKTRRVDAEFLGTGADGVKRFELRARLTFQQAHVVEAALNRLMGSRVKTVPDATNVVVDETSGDVNTVFVESPTTDVVASGDYVVTGWDSTRLNDAYQEVSLVLALENQLLTNAFDWTFDVVFTES